MATFISDSLLWRISPRWKAGLHDIHKGPVVDYLGRVWTEPATDSDQEE